MDESIVQALVLLDLGKCPDLGTGEFRARVTWHSLGDTPESREANRRVAYYREHGCLPKAKGE